MSLHVLSLQDVASARRYYESGYWRDYTLYQRLAHWAERRPDGSCLQDGAGRLTFLQARQYVDGLAARLASAGLRAGDRVAIWLPSRMESVMTLLACSRMGYVCVPSFHRDHTPEEALQLLERCGAAALVVEPGYGARGDSTDIVARAMVLPRMKQVIALRSLRDHLHGGAPRFEGTEPAVELNLPVSPSPDRVIYLAFTSGTTGVAKGVMHSDNTLLANGRAIARDFAFNDETVVYTLSPMSHNMGTVSLVTALACGGELVVHGPLDAPRALDRVVETGARYLVGVPTHAIDLLAQLGDAKHLGSVKVFQLAGAPVPTKLAESLLSRGVMIQNCFGMTENCSFMYTRGTDPASVVTGSCGRCCDGMEASIWNSDNINEPVRDGEIGELGVRGASLMLGYFDDQTTTEVSFNAEGWFMTGDLAQADPDGNFRIVGRIKDLIIRGGRNIHPAHIENLAMRHPAISKAAAIPVADKRLGEKVCLAVISADTQEIDPDSLLEHLDACGLSLYDMPEFFLQLSSFPQTASGKVLKRELAAMVADGRLVPRPIRWRPKQTASSA